MSLIVRVTSADNSRVFVRKLDGANPRIAVPLGARVAIVDEATGEVLPATPRLVTNAAGEQQLVFELVHEGEEVVVELAQAEVWPADVQLALNEGLAPAAVGAELAEAEIVTREAARFEIGEGAGGIGAVGWVVFGLIAVGAVAVAAGAESAQEPPPPPPPPADTTAPAAPTGLNLSDTSDANGDDRVATGTGLIFTGTAEVGSIVRIFANGTQIGTIPAGAGGAFSLTVNLPEGTSAITVTATDAAGNTSVASAPLSVVVDLTAPAAPGVLDLIFADDNGASNTDSVVSGGQNLTIIGQAEGNSTLRMFRLVGGNEVLLNTVTTSAGNTFSIDVNLPEGVNQVVARATDAVGNVSQASAPLTITVDNSAPAAPTGLDLAAEDDDGTAIDDNITDQTTDLTFSGNAEAGSTVRLFSGSTSLGTTVADASGRFTFTTNLTPGTKSITATATDQFGFTSAASAPLSVQIGSGPQALNTSIDGAGDVVTIYFDEAIDPASAPAASQFSITGNGHSMETVVLAEAPVAENTLAEVIGVEVVGNRIRLFLDTAISAADAPVLSYTAAEGTVVDAAGNEAGALEGVALTNDLSTTASGGIELGKVGRLALAGAEITAFDPASDRFFVTSDSGLQIVGVNSNLVLTLLGTLTLGSNVITSVAVKNGLVAVAVSAADKTQPGTVYILDADAPVGAGMVLSQVTVGALPDMLTFTPDGTKILVANEGEQSEEDGVNTVINPEGSVSIITVTNPAAPTVQTAGFTAFNDDLLDLRAEGVRLFSGNQGFENLTVAQDLEPEYIAISPDGKKALITLQENNAVAVLDIATATIIDIQPLGLKPFEGLLADFTDTGNTIGLRDDNPVFGQFMPDAISSFVAGDGKTYYVIANEGDDRDDFIDPNETARLSAVNLDPTAFPNAAAIKNNNFAGRLTVSALPFVNGDTDRDGDVDQILTYGARSFSILNEFGAVVFDSGSQIEEFVALSGLFAAGGLFDDGRSDNKGPEPEGITTGVFGESVLAFVALERGGGGVMVYDVTDPADVQFVKYLRDVRDVSPEGLIYIKASDSPSGEAILAVSNEVSNSLSLFEIKEETAFTLQLLHIADGEAGLLASTTAPKIGALIDAFEDQYFNSITLAGGDNFIPGPFFAAGADPSITAVLPGGNVQGRVDIAIHNAMGVQASTIGNHEFDFGSQGFADAFRPSGAWVGAQFPYLSANLDFSGDSVLNPAFTETLGVNGLENAASNRGRIVPSAVIYENGEPIGIVGVTTQVLEAISSPTGTEVKGFPTGPGANGEADNMAQLAAILQPYINDLRNQGVNKIILMSHLQLIANEQALAPLLEGVDIILAAGSNTRLSDANDTLVAFPGHPAVSQGAYPIVTAGTDGAPTLIVNTDNEYTYLGRLVVEFDADGEIVVGALDNTVNGAYAATDANVARAWNTTEANLATTAYAEGTRGETVDDLTGAVQAVIAAKSGNVYGYSSVYLEGARAAVRSQETNLGNFTADANGDAAKDALGLGADDFLVSLKNGGGIRSQIGTVSGTATVVFGPNPNNAVSQLDVENSLRFNNGLMVFDTTPQGLLNILNTPSATTTNNGGFFQLGGIEVSFDPDFAAGSRIVDVALVAEDGSKVAVVDNGVVVAGAPAVITVVALNFTANGGDGYAIKANGENFRFLLADGTVSAAVDEALNFTAAGVVPTNILGEQKAFEDYMRENFGTPDKAFNEAETPIALDERIQNLNFRDDTVLEGTTPVAPPAAMMLEENFA